MAISPLFCYTDQVVLHRENISVIVEIPPKAGDVVQLVRTLPCHGRGREFESRRPRQLFKNLQRSAAIIPPKKPAAKKKRTAVHEKAKKEPYSR